MTHKLLPLLAMLAVLGHSTPVGAQTTIPGGTISVDTTWDLTGSPYNVTSRR